jgi:hypothetical protein
LGDQLAYRGYRVRKVTFMIVFSGLVSRSRELVFYTFLWNYTPSLNKQAHKSLPEFSGVLVKHEVRSKLMLEITFPEIPNSLKHANALCVTWKLS